MKAIHSVKTANICGIFIAFFCLTFSRLAPAQPNFILGPEVRITSPANHATFFAPVDIPIFAYVRAATVEATFTNVEFFAGTNDLGSGFNLGFIGRVPPLLYADFVLKTPILRLGAIYCLVWTNAPPGSYVLTAVASGRISYLPSFNMSRTSAPVNINVLISATNKNPTDVVSVLATDPIAIAGTNSYWTWSGTTNPVPAWTNWPPSSWQIFTNWGPKNASFTIRRFGDASAPLTITYNLGGTASNGVDYVQLTNSVTIPAGNASALITIVPMDNGAINFAKTVILTLAPDTNAPPNYLVGFPARAAAIIFDNWRRAFPLPFLLPDGSFHVNANGPDGAWFGVQSSADLQNWNCLSTNQVFQGSIDFIDPTAPTNSSFFYRALPLTNAPMN